MAKTFIIAEAGVNHNGSVELAKQLIDVAANAGANAVKFQTFKTENLVSRGASKAAYQVEGTDENETQFEMLKKLELDVDTHRELMQYSNDRNILFLSTPFDHESIDLLNNLNIPIFKIPSGEITNLPLIRKIAQLNKKIILSTGMATMEEVAAAVQLITNSGTSKDKITVLHCNTDYPTPMLDVNLRAMITIQEKFDIAVGYSDHTLGIEVPIAAVSLGATIIEKHFTLDNSMEGPDHRASLEPKELIEMIIAIRNIENALGDGIKKPSSSELKNKIVARKSIYLKTALSKGKILTEKDLIMRRPGEGISPMDIENVVGAELLRDVHKDALLSWEDIK